MLIFMKFLKTQSDQNIHQNAPNRTHFLNILRELAYAPESHRIYVQPLLICIST